MGTLSIINAGVFDGVSDGLADGPVHVADGRIVSVGEPAEPAGQVIDARGGTVLPGLIDAHCHAYGISLDMMATESQPLSYVALAAARRLGRALARGFTTVRDPAGGDAGLARAIAEDLIASPRYLWTGAALSQTGGHGDARGPDSETCPCYAHGCEVVDGVEPAAQGGPGAVPPRRARDQDHDLGWCHVAGRPDPDPAVLRRGDPRGDR